MRLHLTLTPNIEPVPFNYQHQLTGVLHRWLGQNDLHDKISFYSFSWLRGYSEAIDEHLNFPRGVKWFISFWEDEYTKKLVKGILAEPSVMYGMKVMSVQVQQTPNFSVEKNRFRVASPVLLRKNEENESRKHLIYKDEESSELMTLRFISKVKQAGILTNGKPPKLRFDQSYIGSKTKLANIKGVKLITSICPVIIDGTPEVLKFAWNVGVGELTGSGFGAIE